jgi:endonuclease YncB( thermonuclease family)
MFTYELVTYKIVDADTLDMEADLGFRNKHSDRFRLAGINAGESNTDIGRDGILFVQQWFIQHKAPWALRTLKDRQEKFGRYLAIVQAVDGHILNDDLVDAGLAVKWDGKGKKPTPPGRKEETPNVGF